MPRLETRVSELEAATAAADVCSCPVTIQVNYRDGISGADDGAGAVSELCPRCGRRCEIIRIRITADTVAL
jgi:hypothetical protein